MGHEIKLVDALVGLRSRQTNSVDLIVTDPPYDTLEKWREQGTTTRLKNSAASSNAWFPTLSPELLRECFTECFRVLKRDTHMYVMCDEETGDNLKPILREVGFNLRKSLIWHKVGKRKSHHCPSCGTLVCESYSPGTPGMGYPYRSQWEMILLAEKGKRKPPENRSVRNVLEVPWIKGKQFYPTQKPHALAQILIRQSSLPGELVVDPFAGSCSTGYAAFLEGRNFLGFDTSENAIQFARDWQSSWIKVDPEKNPESRGQLTVLDLFGLPAKVDNDT